MADCADPVHTTELVLLPKMAPLPPVAIIMASPAKARTSMVRRSMATMPRHTPFESMMADRNSQPSYLRHLAFGFVAANLLIERVEKLLAGGCAGERSAVVKRATEATEIEQPFRGAIEGHAHAVQQVDNGRARFAHGLDRGLVGQEVAAVYGVVKVLPASVAFAFEVFGRVDAALRAHAGATV